MPRLHDVEGKRLGPEGNSSGKIKRRRSSNLPTSHDANAFQFDDNEKETIKPKRVLIELEPDQITPKKPKVTTPTDTATNNLSSSSRRPGRKRKRRSTHRRQRHENRGGQDQATATNHLAANQADGSFISPNLESREELEEGQKPAHVAAEKCKATAAATSTILANDSSSKAAQESLVPSEKVRIVQSGESPCSTVGVRVEDVTCSSADSPIRILSQRHRSTSPMSNDAEPSKHDIHSAVPVNTVDPSVDFICENGMSSPSEQPQQQQQKQSEEEIQQHLADIRRLEKSRTKHENDLNRRHRENVKQIECLHQEKLQEMKTKIELLQHSNALWSVLYNKSQTDLYKRDAEVQRLRTTCLELQRQSIKREREKESL